MRPNHNHHYRQILTRIVQNCRVHCGRTLQEPLARADWEEQAAEVHDRYVALVDEEIRWEICEAARQALERMKEGKYGRCMECGGEIGFKRLAAVPWTERCVDCQARAEQHCEPPPAVTYLPSSERNAA